MVRLDIPGSYDRLAGEYARRLFHELENKPLDRQLLNRFAAETRGRGRVCDLGCGPGQVARYLREAGADIFGVDLSLGMVEAARRLNPDIAFAQGDMIALGIGDGALAGIAAFYAIVNIPEASLPVVFREMARVLQTGGLLLLAFHAGDEVIQVEEMWGRRVQMNFFFFQRAAVVRDLEAAGFVVKETIERGPYAPEVEHQSRRAYIFAERTREQMRGAADVVR